MYRRRLELSNRIESYIQTLVLKKTLEGISLDFRRNESLEEFFSTERSVCLEAKPENEEPLTLAGTT
jgi:hypothetical protein